MLDIISVESMLAIGFSKSNLSN